MQKNGFTLIEIILTMGLLSILITVLSTIFGEILDLKMSSSASSAVAQDSRYLMQRFLYDLGRASTVTAPAAGVSSSQFVFSDGSSTYTYAVADGTLTLTTGSETTALTGAGSVVENAVFTRSADQDDQSTVSLVMTLSSKIDNPNQHKTRSFTVTGGVR